MANQVVLRDGAAYDATYALPIICNHTCLQGTRGLLVAWLVWFDPPPRDGVEATAIFRVAAKSILVLHQYLRKHAHARDTRFCVQGVKVLRCLCGRCYRSLVV